MRKRAEQAVAKFKKQRERPPGERTHELTDAARKAQQMSEAQFRGFLEASPDAVIVVDQTGRINFASNRIEAMFGHLPSELVGKPLSVLIPERDRDLHAGHLDRFMNDPNGSRQQNDHLRPPDCSMNPCDPSDDVVSMNDEQPSFSNSCRISR